MMETTQPRKWPGVVAAAAGAGALVSAMLALIGAALSDGKDLFGPDSGPAWFGLCLWLASIPLALASGVGLIAAALPLRLRLPLATLLCVLLAASGWAIVWKWYIAD
ncbi:MAG: hypothetical protein QOG53_2511 [Frankiales bacterium]|jgi:hypothetical protein|nr:hypothetical protein [Frankiales bacterium]